MYKNMSWAAVIICMILIFNLSSQTAKQSNELSKFVTKVIVNTVKMVFPESDFNAGGLNNIVRKNAHFFAYLVLGVLIINAFMKSGMSAFKSISLTLLICIVYAVSDEFHQMFVFGRGASITDVLIDSAGTSIGIGGYMLIKKVMRK